MSYPVCPICNSDLIVEGRIFVDGSLGESYERCPKEHFSSDYSYGVTRYTIGNKVFAFSYQDSLIEISDVMGKVNEAIKEYKEGINV